jgi:hypothetical protein
MNKEARIKILKSVIDNLIHLQEVEPDLYKTKDVTSRIETYVNEYKSLRGQYILNTRRAI